MLNAWREAVEFFLPPPITKLTRSCSVACPWIFLLALKIYNNPDWHPCVRKSGFPAHPSHEALASFAPHKPAGGSSISITNAQDDSLASVRNNSDHNRKEILGILSSCWEVPAHSSCKRIQVPTLMLKLQHHPRVLYTFNRSLVINSINSLPALFIMKCKLIL